ncbi:metallophosphatase domain-containing protein [Glacieibacterium frigidum]|nr:metallophosphatase domain-containing protein [Glacieibacterium frigidum]
MVIAVAVADTTEGTHCPTTSRVLVDRRMQTRVTVISDTHWRHDDIALPAGDLLIHCGDMFNLSTRAPQQVRAMDEWFGRQKFERILCTGGNHDRLLEAELTRGAQPFRNAQFVMDEIVEYRGLRIFGAPWVPELRTHAFYRDRSSLADAWARVPSGIDILITHTPPRGVLDTSSRGRSLGCEALAGELQRIAPRVHCFGHVHAGAGRRQVGGTLFINAASYDGDTGAMRPAAIFTLSSGTGAQPMSWASRLARRWLPARPR